MIEAVFDLGVGVVREFGTGVRDLTWGLREFDYVMRVLTVGLREFDYVVRVLT